MTIQFNPNIESFVNELLHHGNKTNSRLVLDAAQAILKLEKELRSKIDELDDAWKVIEKSLPNRHECNTLASGIKAVLNPNK